MGISKNVKEQNNCKIGVTVEEYREMLNDEKSSDDQIRKNLEYLKALCVNVIRIEIKSYVESTKKQYSNTPA